MTLKNYKIGLCIIYCLFNIFNLNAEKVTNHGLVLSMYNEPLLKPGVTIGFDHEIELTKNHRFGIVLPEFTYFYFENNYQAFYLYPEISYRYISNKGFYTGISFGSGWSISQKIVPVYNLEGEEIDAEWNNQLFMTSALSFGWDFEESNNNPIRVYFNIGWKGIYPDNLGVLNQPMMQLGIKYTFFEKEWK
ncbi:MAG: hypothetical protein OCD02_02280 [Spirochaetaceae bacterium]